MRHVKLVGMMSPMEKMANVAASAAQSAREATTRQSGTISVPNADGTRSILGVQNGNGRSMATHVGDTTPPGKPLGVSAASSSGVLVAYWSGELEGGIPDDFAKLVVKAKTDGEGEQVLGELYAEGSVSSNRLTVGKTYTVWATAEDDACAEDGTDRHNVSEASDSMRVTMTAAADAAAVEAAQKAANEAKALAQTLVASVDVEYALGDTSTTAPTSGWSTDSPAWTQGKYIWQRTKSVDGSGAESYSEPTCIQGAKGDPGKDGSDGASVSVSAIEYQVSASGTTPPTGAWLSQIPTAGAGMYVWTRTSYSDGKKSYTVALQGKDGSKGEKGDPGSDGKGVRSTDVSYQLSTSGTTVPTGTWQSSVLAPTTTQYLWTMTVTTYTDNSTTTSYSVGGKVGAPGAKGDPGDKGETGVGVSAIVEEYYLSTSPTAQSGGSWGTSQPAWAESHYIWTRSKVTWTNGSETYTQPVLAKAINSANEVASKTTWYFWADSEGAHVATSKQDATSGANILLTGDGIKIRQGTTVVASFSTSLIELGKNSDQSVINLCSGAGEIGAITSALGSMLALFGNTVGIKGNQSAMMASPGAYAIATGDGLSLNANGSLILGSNVIVVGKTDGNLTATSANGNAVVTVTNGTGENDAGISVENTSEKGNIALTVGSRGSDTGLGLIYDESKQAFKTYVTTPYIGMPKGTESSDRLYDQIETKEWMDVYRGDDGIIRWCVRSGCVWISVIGLYNITGTGGWKVPNFTLPERYRLRDGTYIPLTTRQSNNTAQMWTDGTGELWFYSFGSGWEQRAYGIVSWPIGA